MNRGPKLIEHIVKSKVLFPIALIFSISAWALTSYNWIVALIYGLMTFFLWIIERRFTLFRTKSQLHLTFFVLFSILTPELHTDVKGSLIMVLLTLSIYLLFNSYQQRDAVLPLHFIGILGGIGALIDPRTTIFIFIIWFIAYQVQAIHIKGFISSLLGMVLPIILWATYLLVNNHLAQFPDFIYQYKNLYIPQIPIFQWIHWNILGFISILVITATTYLLQHAHYDKRRIATYMGLISTTSISLILCLLFFSDWWTVTIPSLYGITSLLVGHYFSNQKRKFIGVTLVIILLLISAMGVYGIMELK